MTLFKTTTDEASSTLAKGIAKEKQLTRDLQHQYPNADITRTPKIADGGKDIIVEHGDDIVYHEVKNWERPMSSYDIHRYNTPHENSPADLNIYSEGGFTDRAQVVANKNGIGLTSGNEYTSPKLPQKIFSHGIRGYNRVETCTHRFKNAVCENLRQVIEGPVERTVANSIRGIKRTLLKMSAWVYRRLSINHIVLLPALLALIWLFIKWWNDEYTHRDLLKALGVILLSITSYYIIEKVISD